MSGTDAIFHAGTDSLPFTVSVRGYVKCLIMAERRGKGGGGGGGTSHECYQRFSVFLYDRRTCFCALNIYSPEGLKYEV